eukprot:g29328.t1
MLRAWSRPCFVYFPGVCHGRPRIPCFLRVQTLRAVEHLTLDKLKEENRDKYIWQALEERFPDRLSHDWLAECLKEVFQLAAKDGETIAAWTSRVQEAFSKCRRKVSVDFPSQARGWICLTSSGLSADQHAIVTAKANGELKFEVVAAAMSSCFPEFRASRKSRPATALLVQQPEIDESETEVGIPPPDEGPDAVSFDEVEAFLAEHGVQEPNTVNEVFDEDEIAEVLAATWRERRSEISKLQKSRRFGQAATVKKQFSREITDLQKKSRCRACGQIGHWARNCPQRSSSSASGSRTDTDKALVAIEKYSWADEGAIVKVYISASSNPCALAARGEECLEVDFQARGFTLKLGLYGT